MTTTWLLPGMDATGFLWRPLLAALGGRSVRPLAYPSAVVTYDQVLEHVGVPDDGTILVAESFSTPAAVCIAAEHPERVRALVVVAGFLSSPSPLPAALLAPLFSIRPPRPVIRALMVGRDATDELVELVRGAIASVPAPALAGRLRESARTDVRRTFSELRVPIVWARASEDRLVRAGATREASACRPDLDVRVVPGPHLLAQARPQAVAELVREAQRRYGAAG